MATYTRLLVEKAKKANPGIIVAVARKALPGLRHLYYRCVLCGGASMHRMGISDTVLIFPNHTRLIGDPYRVLERLDEARGVIGERSITIEASSLEEALVYAKSGIVDEIQLDHVDPHKLPSIVAQIKSINPKVRIAIGGGINYSNIEAYAKSGVDVIVTSAPFWAKPVDLTTRIEPLPS